jgi:hypothetical protein
MAIDAPVSCPPPVTPAGLARDMALLLMLKAPGLSPGVLTTALLDELQAWARRQPAPVLTKDAAQPVTNAPRTDAIDHDAVKDFRIANMDSLERAMRPDSVSRFVDQLRTRRSGLVLAMLRQHHIVASCLALAQLTRGGREAVFVFDPPDRSDASARLWALFEGLDDHVRVVSTSPRDVARAVRHARDGAAIAIAADVVSDSRSAVSVPWGEGTRSVMMGAAYAAAAAGAALAAVSPVRADENRGDVRIDFLPDASDLFDRSAPGLYRRTLTLWEALEQQADTPFPPPGGLPVRELAARIDSAGTLRGCLANLALAYPPLASECPHLLAWLSEPEKTGGA